MKDGSNVIWMEAETPKRRSRADFELAESRKRHFSLLGIITPRTLLLKKRVRAVLSARDIDGLAENDAISNFQFIWILNPEIFESMLSASESHYIA